MYACVCLCVYVCVCVMHFVMRPCVCVQNTNHNHQTADKEKDQSSAHKAAQSQTLETSEANITRNTECPGKWGHREGHVLRRCRILEDWHVCEGVFKSAVSAARWCSRRSRRANGHMPYQAAIR